MLVGCNPYTLGPFPALKQSTVGAVLGAVYHCIIDINQLLMSVGSTQRTPLSEGLAFRPYGLGGSGRTFLLGSYSDNWEFHIGLQRLRVYRIPTSLVF